MAESYEDEMALLYDDVLARLNRGETLTDMDLDTLVEVYDYAYDLSDEYVTAEIMTNVLSRDGDYQPMLERKAFRYSMLSELQGAKAIVAKLPADSFVRRLVMSQANWDADNWKDSYEKLFAGVEPHSLDRYSMMCLIDFALSVDEVSHLSELLAVILPLCECPEDFLVDLSGTLLDNDHAEADVPVLLELTTLQPFSLDYWLQLGELYINRLDNYEEGYSAIDYALAIDPDSGRAMMLKGDLLMKVEGYTEEVHKLADRLMQMDDFKEDALYLKAGAYIKEGKNAEATEFLKRYTEVCNNPLDIFVLIMSINEGKIDGDLKRRLVEFVKDADVAEITRWIARARSVSDDKSMAVFINAIVDADVLVSDEVFSLVIIYLYRSADYIKVKELYEEREQSADMNPFDSLVYLMCRLRLGDPKGVRELLGDKGDEIYEIVRNAGPEGKLLHVGAAKLVYDMHRYLDSHKGKKPDMKALDKLDPFII